jgi:hypothetical protein
MSTLGLVASLKPLSPSTLLHSVTPFTATTVFTGGEINYTIRSTTKTSRHYSSSFSINTVLYQHYGDI